jgi:outer membrane immunogenic protein
MIAKHKSRRLRALALTAGFASGAAVAHADGPYPYVPPLPNWTGVYVGGHAGYSWGRWDGALTHDAGLGPVAEIFDPDERTIGANGWLGGGQIGFNYQRGILVFGFEADSSWTHLDGQKTFSTIDQGNDGLRDFTWKIENQLDWFATVRGRAGIVAHNFLFYGTGGVAFGHTKGSEVVTGFEGQGFPATGQVTAVGSTSENHIGWSAGGGIEWLVSPRLSIRAEYLYLDLGSASYRFIGTTFVGQPHTTDSFPADLTFHTVRIGLNAKL